jgi:imidazole glycerol-phosphate synthase subunit HisH
MHLARKLAARGCRLLVYVDLPVSNTGSVLRAFRLVGASAKPARVPADLDGASAILLPGVGSFGHAMAWLQERGLSDALRASVRQGVPILGICLGMQLLADFSEEGGGHQGLGFVAGRVTRLPSGDPNHRVPNMGWCDVRVKRTSILFPKSQLRTLYHVHSYYLDPVSADASTAVIDFAGREISVGIEQGNIFGVQFHPEKSQDRGLEIIAAFLGHCGLLTTPPPGRPCPALG